MGRAGNPKIQIALILLALALITRLVLIRIGEGASHSSGVIGIVISAVVSLALVAVALVLQWRATRRK